MCLRQLGRRDTHGWGVFHIVTALEAAQTTLGYRIDPQAFLRDKLGDEPYQKQIEFLEAAATKRRVSVVGCNSSGKDWTSGRLIAWWESTRYPAKTIVLAPTFRQVNDIVWREYRMAFKSAQQPLGGTMFDTPRWHLDDQHFALGFSTADEFSLQGFHSPNLMVIVSEAHAMPQTHIDAIKRLNPRLIIMTGNPFTLMGEFYESHHAQRSLWNPIAISAYDTPNLIEGRDVIPGMVTVEDVEERKEEWGEESALYLMSILGQFPDSLSDSIVPLNVAIQASERTLEPEGPHIVAVDVARFGMDKTVVCDRQGPVARLVWKAQSKDTQEVGKWLQRYSEEQELTPQDIIVVDDVGVGGGVTDYLRHAPGVRARIIPFTGGGKARDAQHYYNAVTECWMLMGKAFKEADLDIEHDQALISQVATRQYTIMNDRRLKVQSKEDMRPNESGARSSWHSPDEADALAMTFAVRYTEAPRISHATKRSSWRDG